MIYFSFPRSSVGMHIAHTVCIPTGDGGNERSSDGLHKWSTVGVSTDVLEAAYRALNDAIEYKLVMDGIAPPEAENNGELLY